jgi:hypothetical protein
MTEPANKPASDSRRRARITALVIGMVAVGIYVAFMLSAVLP